MKTMINIKTDKEVKENAKKIAGELGIPLSTVINAYLKQFIRDKEIYFSLVPKMTSKLEHIISRARRDYKEKKNISKIFSNSGELLDYLRS